MKIYNDALCVWEACIVVRWCMGALLLRAILGITSIYGSVSPGYNSLTSFVLFLN